MKTLSFTFSGSSALRPAAYAVVGLLLVHQAIGKSLDREPIKPIASRENLAISAKLQLGERLFRDNILSRDGSGACVSCHDLESNGASAGTSGGHGDDEEVFDVPTIFNAALNYKFGWRGETASIAEQTRAAIANANARPDAPATDWSGVLERLAASKDYLQAFRSVFGADPDQGNVVDALVAFQTSLVTPSDFDDFLGGEINAISQDAKDGYALFRNYGCVSCHQGANLGGNMLQRFGVFSDGSADGAVSNNADLGRLSVTDLRPDDMVFRVPSLRNVAVTPPYLHNGQLKTLSETVELMGRIQLGRDLPAEDVASITAFLGSLTGSFNGRKLHTPGP